MSISTITNKDNLVVIPNNPSDAYQIGYAIGYQDGKRDASSPWRRVEDELPDKCTQCLVADADGKCAVGYYRYNCEAWDSPAFGWIEAEDRIYIDDIPMGIGKVVAWVPIEPQKEDENADKRSNTGMVWQLPK